MNKSFDQSDGSDAEWSDAEWEERLTAMMNALPREQSPGRLLEERTVTALRKKGLLQSRRPRRIHPLWWAGSIAASLALFATGIVVGQWLGTRSTTEAFIAVRQTDAMNSALQVQRTGTAYVDALQALAQISDSTGVAVPQQGREVALTALHAAANQVIRMAPNDPVAAEIMRGFQRVKQLQQKDAKRQIVWF